MENQTKSTLQTIAISVVGAVFGYAVSIADSYANYKANEQKIIARIERLEEFARESTTDRAAIHTELQDANRLINSKLEVLLLKVAALEAQVANPSPRSK